MTPVKSFPFKSETIRIEKEKIFNSHKKSKNIIYYSERIEELLKSPEISYTQLQLQLQSLKTENENTIEIIKRENTIQSNISNELMKPMTLNFENNILKNNNKRKLNYLN